MNDAEFRAYIDQGTPALTGDALLAYADETLALIESELARMAAGAGASSDDAE